MKIFSAKVCVRFIFHLQMKVLKDGGILSFGGDALDNPKGVSIIEMKATILRPLDK